MQWKLMSLAAVFVAAIVVVMLLLGRGTQAQVTNTNRTAYAYKVERFNRNAKDIDRILSEDGKDGYRVSRVETIGPYHNDVIVVMEKMSASN